MLKFGVLDRYIGKTIFAAIMIALFIMISLSSIIKFIDQLKKVGQGGYNPFGAGIYTLLSLPKDMQVFFPMAVLIGALFGLGNLAQRNELVVMQASGFTRIQIAFSTIKTVIPLVILVIIISEWIVPYSEGKAHDYREKKIYGCSLLSIRETLWLKDGNNFISIANIKDNKELIGVNIYEFNKNRLLESVRYAALAKFNSVDKSWCLFQVDESNLQNPKNISYSRLVSSIWKTNLTPNKVVLATKDPDTFSIIDLYDYIVYLKSSNQKIEKYQFIMWKKISQPLSIAIMILMAISFIFGSLQNITTGTRVAVGISFSFIFYVLDQVFGSLTLFYNISPIIGAILPSIVFFFISLRLLLKVN